MEYRQLGRAGLRISAVGVGCNQLGSTVDRAGTFTECGASPGGDEGDARTRQRAGWDPNPPFVLLAGPTYRC